MKWINLKELRPKDLSDKLALCGIGTVGAGITLSFAGVALASTFPWLAPVAVGFWISAYCTRKK